MASRILDERAEDVRIAIRALDDMRNSGKLNEGGNFTDGNHAPTSDSLRPLYDYRINPDDLAETRSPTPTPSMTTPSLSTATSIPTSPSLLSLSPRATQSRDDLQQESSPNPAAADNLFTTSRVATHPLVSTARRAIEKGKAHSRVVKYGAEMVESLSKPVIDRLPQTIPSSLDDFAYRQLDRLDSYRRPSTPASMSTTTITTRQPGKKTLDGTGSARCSVERTSYDDDSASSSGNPVDPWPSIPGESKSVLPHPSERAGPSPSFELPPLSETGSSWPPPPPSGSYSTPSGSHSDSQQLMHAPHHHQSWQTVLLSTPGLRLSERLRYVLGWLTYATDHIDVQVVQLRDLIASLQPVAVPNADGDTSVQGEREKIAMLGAIKRDLVTTVRQVVGVVSQYGGRGALEEDARTMVRGFLLDLPRRWRDSRTTAGHASPRPAHDVGRSGNGNGSASTSPHIRAQPYPIRHDIPAPANEQPDARPHVHAQHTREAAVQAAQRVLALATESLDMVRGVTGVVRGSLERAEVWAERLGCVPEQGPPSAPPADSVSEDGHERSQWQQSKKGSERPNMHSRSSSTCSLRNLLDDGLSLGFVARGVGGVSGRTPLDEDRPELTQSPEVEQQSGKECSADTRMEVE